MNTTVSVKPCTTRFLMPVLAVFAATEGQNFRKEEFLLPYFPFGDRVLQPVEQIL